VNPQGNYSWLTAAHVLQQGKAMAHTLKSHGYDYINIDAGWWRQWDWTPEYDKYGRPAVDKARFPNGIASVVRKLHKMGLKVGIYMPVGIEKGAYDNGAFPIDGTTNCTTHDIVYPDLRTTNGWDSSYKIDFGKPCSQFYYDSIAHEFAKWGIDFLKLDGVGPGSGRSGANYDNTSDVKAWATALAGSGRRIHLELSWSLSHDDIATWQRWSNGWRVDTDVECYCNTLTSWDHSVKQRFSDVLSRCRQRHDGRADRRRTADLHDALGDRSHAAVHRRRPHQTRQLRQVAADQRRGDRDDQAGVPARPVSTATNQQVWSAKLHNGSYVVALFNLDSTPATVTADLSDLGIDRVSSARNVWQHSSVHVSSDTISENLPAHGSALFRIRAR
jgi:alpha galactosidase C-like protein/alpha galactosidase A-like protein